MNESKEPMTLLKALERNNRVCVQLVNPTKDEKCQCFMFFSNPNDALAKAIDPLVGELVYVGEPTKQMPFSYAKTLFVFEQEDLQPPEDPEPVPEQARAEA